MGEARQWLFEPSFNRAVKVRASDERLAHDPARRASTGRWPRRVVAWRHAQRLLLVIVDKPDPNSGQLNLLSNYFFPVAGWKEEELDGLAALAHYRQRSLLAAS